MLLSANGYMKENSNNPLMRIPQKAIPYEHMYYAEQ